MAPLQQLISFHIIEIEHSGRNFIRWTYPQISNDNHRHLTQKLSTSSNRNIPFLCIKNKNDWIYITASDVDPTNELLTKVKKCLIVLYAKDYYPNKYETLGKVFLRKYLKSANPVELVKLFLSVFTTGSCSVRENGTFISQDFDHYNNANCTKVKELINNFGLETILIYTSLLLKKRIVVYHHNVEVLQKLVHTVTALMLHRNPNDYVFPYVELSSDGLLDLKGKHWFLAGFKDSNICPRVELYDLLVNFPAGEISISPHAKEVLTMTKTQKDIAIFMVQLTESGDKTEGEIVQEISNKTIELLTQLKSLATTQTNENNYMISVEKLKSKRLNASMENFLFNFAIAENLMLL